MKKCAVLFVVFILLLSGCGNVNNKPDKTENFVKSTGKLIKKDLVAASDFSEGLAFVKCKGEKDKSYCINKKGKIVFQLNEDISVANGIYAKYENNFAYLTNGSLIGAICNID